MKICFFSSDSQVKEISQLMEGVEISVLNSTANVSNYLENNNGDKTLLFLDLDDGDSAHELNRKYLDDGQVIRIMITEKVPIKKLKKHQAGKESAFGYIKKPLTPEIVSGVLNDFELSEYVEKHDLTHEGDKVEQDQVDLTFIGIKKPDLTNVDIEEDEAFSVDESSVPKFDAAPEESTGTMGDMQELRVKMEATDVEIDEIDLDDDIDIGDEEVSSEPEPVPMSNAEKTAFIEKGMMEEEGSPQMAAPPYESVVNEGIQEKFDRVFGVEKSAFNAPTVDDLPEDQQDQFEEPEVEEVNITLDGFDEDTGEVDLAAEISVPEESDSSDDSFVSAPDEINLEDAPREKTQVVIEKAIINDPGLDGNPAEAIVADNDDNDQFGLISRLDEEVGSEESKGNFMEVSLADIKLDDELGVTGNSGDELSTFEDENDELAEELEFGTGDDVALDPEPEPAEEEINEYGLKKGHVEDGFMYMGGDPSDANNWKEVKS